MNQFKIGSFVIVKRTEVNKLDHKSLLLCLGDDNIEVSKKQFYIFYNGLYDYGPHKTEYNGILKLSSYNFPFEYWNIRVYETV